MASAATTVGGSGSYVWESDAIVDDVQSWLDGPDANFGWIVIGDESNLQTAKRFDSREFPGEDVWPALIVEFTAG